MQSQVRGTGGVLALSLLISGCAVGPNFNAPAAPVNSDQYSYTGKAKVTETVKANTFAGQSQKLSSGQDIPAAWWEVFHSEALDKLIRESLKHNPTLASAQAALRQAQENYNSQADSVLYPSVTGNLGAQRQHASAVSTNVPGGKVLNLYNASVNVSYSVDVFGANKRGLESVQAGVDYQRYQLEATYLTLTANVVTTAIREASLRSQLQATQEILEAQTSQLNVIEKQFTVGAIPKASLLAQRNLVAQTRASLPALQKSVDQTRNQLAVLAGKLPGDADLPEFSLDNLQLPQELPVSVPSALVRQRPDILAVESLLHQASAQVGVATANQYPQFSLTGSYGYSSTDSSKLFNNSMSFWSVGGGLVAPIFNAGALSAKRRASEAAYDQAAAQYRSTVLSAFQNVADTLRALELDAQTLKQQAEVEALAKDTLELTMKQYKLGGVSSLTLLDAKRTYQSARINLVQAQANRYADTAALFQAMGGGWWNRPELADISRTDGTTEKALPSAQ
ncbi:efflux transporter outer membrane subunit [Undibacterium jejuense]|uniref:Efflux transporter outer membrane subunit n=1 Tax=Undibacterium jejuense TaxID=1344949 RepID=A0A923KJ30_9BURK|nr:efflux transporter outer membrane subunit [Undibacterium jejuense]